MTWVGNGLQNYALFTFGTWNDRFGQEYNKLKGQGSIWERSKQAYRVSVQPDKKVLENLGQAQGRADFVDDIGKSLKRAGKYARGYDANGYKISGKKAIGKIIKGGMKRMPLIGNALTVVTEAPGIYHSFNDYGGAEGVKQTARVGLNLAGFAGGAAAGGAIAGGIAAGAAAGSVVPIVGTIIGGIIGGIAMAWGANKLFGKSKVEEQEEIQGLYQSIGQDISKEQAIAMVKQGIKAEDVQAEVEALMQSQQTSPNFTGQNIQPQAQQQVQTTAQNSSLNMQGGSGFAPAYGGIKFGDEWMSQGFITLPTA